MAQVIDLETGELVEQELVPAAPAAAPEASSTQIIDVEGDGGLVPINQQEMQAVAAESATEEEPGTAVGNFIRSLPGGSVIQPALTIASGMVSEPVAGLEGAARAIASPVTGEKATDISGEIGETRQMLSFDTTDPGGQRMLRFLGTLVEQGVDLASLPLEGLQSIASLMGTGDPLLADAAIDEMREKGVSQYLGDRILSATGSEAAAAATTTLPTAIASLFGVKTKPRGQPGMPGAEDIVDAGKATGIDVLTTDVAPPATAFGRMSQVMAERVPFAGTGGLRGKQRQQRLDAIEALENATPEVQAADIFDSLKNSVQTRKRAAGKRLESMRNKIMEGPNLDASFDDLVRMPADDLKVLYNKLKPEGAPEINMVSEKSADLIIDRIQQFQAGRAKPNTGNGTKALEKAIADLSKKGKIKDENFIAGLEELFDDLEEAATDFEALRTFRTDFRTKIVEKVDAAGRSQLSSSEQVAMDNVLRGITKDLDNIAKDKLTPREFQRYKQADKVYAEEARMLTKSRLKSVLDKGDVKPELVNNLLFSSSPSEVKALWKNLDQSGRDNARFALLNRAFKNAETKGEISPEKFLTQLDKMEDNFGVFFRGEQGRDLQGLRKVLEATRRADQAGLVTPTGQQLLVPLMAMMTGASFFSPGAAIGTSTIGTIGAIGRLYESSLVRNRIIRAANANKEEVLSIARELPVLLAASQQEEIQE